MDAIYAFWESLREYEKVGVALLIIGFVFECAAWIMEGE